MKQILALSVILAFTILNAGVAKATVEYPAIQGNPAKGDAVIGYSQAPGRSLEAWEIVLVNGNSSYLNYSRAPWGDPEISGKPTQVCYAKSKNQKIVGISEKADRLKLALETTMAALDNTSEIEEGCSTYVDLLSKNPMNSSLIIYLKSL